MMGNLIRSPRRLKKAQASQVVLSDDAGVRVVTITHPPNDLPFKLQHLPTGAEYYRTIMFDGEQRPIYRARRHGPTAE
jgi:hypothetical protein